MRTQRLMQRSDCEPEYSRTAISTQKSAPLVRLAYLTNGAQNMGRTYFRFSCHSRRGFSSSIQAQITLDAGWAGSAPLPDASRTAQPFSLVWLQSTKLALAQIGSELPEGLRQAVLQFQIQFLRFKGGKSR